MAIGVHSSSAVEWFSRGIAYAEQERIDEAIGAYREALALDPRFVLAWNNLGNLYGLLGRFAEALDCFDLALAIDPLSSLINTNKGIVLSHYGEQHESLARFALALKASPDDIQLHTYHGVVRLRNGDYKTGWSEFGWRYKSPGGLPKMDKPLWDGSPLDGKTILLTPEQGLGDAVQFIRYARWLKQRYDCRVLAVCQPELSRLLATCPGVDGWVDHFPIPPYDWFAPLLHVPGVLGHAEFPADVPYIAADPDLVEQWRDRLPTGAIGVCWRGNPKNANDLMRSIPLQELAPLAKLRPLVSLQKGTDETLPGMITLDLDSAGAFVDSAAVIKNLELVITCDTAIAHVAGALGVQVWLALCKVPDWRWGLEGATTPWYPTMRLFRQTVYGDWAGVMRRMADALER